MNHRMQRFLWASAVIAAELALGGVGCVEKGPADPTPPPPIQGAYTLTVEASAVCKLPVSRFVWEVEATSSGQASLAGDTMLSRATLPAGDATVDLSLSANISSLVTGVLSARSAAFGDDSLRLTLGGPTRGTITSGPAGRGQIVDGIYNGEIALAPPEDPDAPPVAPDPDSAGSCTAANHKWTLVPR
jgi:hypothetical protein